MKKIIILTLTVLLLTSCIKDTTKETFTVQSPKPVKVQKVENKPVTVHLYYDGLVDAKNLQKLGFKTPGTIESIPVNEGDSIENGTILAKLNTEDLEFSFNSAKQNLKMAQSQYQKALNGASSEQLKQAEMNVKKAEEAYNFADDTYNNWLAIKEQGGDISDFDLSKAETEKEIAKYSYQQAEEAYNEALKGSRSEDIAALKSQVELANTDYQHKKQQIEQCEIISSIDGYVAQILMEENEIVDSGYPVVVIRSKDSIINVSFSQKEIALIEPQKEVTIESDNTIIKGIINRIADLPDPNTLTYNVEIIPEENTFRLGSIVNITIPVSTQKGIWIPIQHVKSSYDDYVYIIENNVVIKRKIIIKNISGSYARVEGLTHGDMLVVEGHKKLQVNDPVTIVE